MSVSQTVVRSHLDVTQSSESCAFSWNQIIPWCETIKKKTWLSPKPDMNVFLFSFHFYSLTVMFGSCQESSGLIPELRHIKGTHECVPSSLHITKTQMHVFLYLHFIGHLLEMEICWTRDQKCVTQTSQIQDGRTGGYVYCYLISCNKTVVDEQ